MFQPSESVPRPLVQNAAIEKAEAPGAYESRALPFRAHTPTELLTMAPPALEAALAAVYRSVASTKTAAERSNTLLYCESLATDARLATLLVNSAVGELVASLLRGDAKAVPSLKLRLATLLGLLLRHATFVRAGFARGALLLALTDAANDRGEKVRRRGVAALGELLFYIAVQQGQTPTAEAVVAAAAARIEGAPPPPPAGDDWAEEWSVPPAATAALLDRLSM